jgi:hypothetical protein
MTRSSRNKCDHYSDATGATLRASYRWPGCCMVDSGDCVAGPPSRWSPSPCSRWLPPVRRSRRSPPPPTDPHLHHRQQHPCRRPRHLHLCPYRRPHHRRQRLCRRLHRRRQLPYHQLHHRQQRPYHQLHHRQQRPYHQLRRRQQRPYRRIHHRHQRQCRQLHHRQHLVDDTAAIPVTVVAAPRRPIGAGGLQSVRVD